MTKLSTMTAKIKGDHLHKQTCGWFLPYLLGMDAMPGIGHLRWTYWLAICERGELPPEPIPQVDFVCHSCQWHNPYPNQMPETPDQHIKRILTPYVQKGYWYDDAFLAFVKWFLWGCGIDDEDIERDVDAIPEDVRDFWYTQFNLAYLLSCPIDWPAHILQGGPSWMQVKSARWAKATRFFSTPMSVCRMMADMSFLTYGGEDCRAKTVLDPCVGTGSMLLIASNYSLRLYGQDIVADLVRCAQFNGFLWMPWLVFNPPSVREMWKRIDPQAKEVPTATLSLETDPEAVEEIKQYRAAQLAQIDIMKEKSSANED